MKALLVSLFIILSIQVSIAQIDPNHKTIICSGNDDDTYFGASFGPPGPHAPYISFDVTNNHMNDSYAMNIVKKEILGDFLRFVLRDGHGGNYVLDIHIKTGLSNPNIWVGSEPVLRCKSSPRDVTDIDAFITRNKMTNISCVEDQWMECKIINPTK